MKKTLKPIKLENIKSLSGKKEARDLVYFYNDYKFNLYQMGKSAKGLDIFRITPVNFDNLLLKTFCKKTFPAKGYSTIETDNIKDFLKLTFDEINRIKTKKAAALKAYKKAVKDGTLPVEEVKPKEVKLKSVKPNKSNSAKPLTRKKVEATNKPKVAVDSYYSNDEKKSYGKNNSSKKSYSKNTTEKNSYSKNNTEKKSYDKKEKSSFSTSGRKSFGNDNKKAFSKFSKKKY